MMKPTGLAIYIEESDLMNWLTWKSSSLIPHKKHI